MEIDTNLSGKRVLVAPLDWGLGHATRCIPIIRELLEQQAEVILAADGRPYALLQKEFPRLEIVRLEGHQITYPKTGKLIRSMVGQLPAIRSSIRREHSRLKDLIKEHKIDLVISDNRYGLWSKDVPSVFISHQIKIQLPKAWQWSSVFLDAYIKKLISKFDHVWVPDVEGEISLSGKLSHGEGIPEFVKYCGLLSRYEAAEKTESKYEVAVILSGPEPQRSILEEILLDQLKKLQLKSILIRGVTESNQDIDEDGIRVVDFMTAHDLNEICLNSKLIIARPGYSTLMDLAKLGVKGAFIPTPGQTEQEYLAQRLHKNRIAPWQDQSNIDLVKLIEDAAAFDGFSEMDSGSLLKKRLAEIKF